MDPISRVRRSLTRRRLLSGKCHVCSVPHPLIGRKITEVVEPKKKVAAAPVETKKRKAEVIDSPAPAAAAAAAGDVSVEGLSKAQQKKLAKKARRESEGSTAAPVAEKKVEKVQEKKAAPVAEKKQKVRK